MHSVEFHVAVPHSEGVSSSAGCKSSTEYLQLHFNSTKRSPWNAKMGVQSDPSFVVRLATVRSDGGSLTRWHFLLTLALLIALRLHIP